MKLSSWLINVSVYECPPTSAAVNWAHVLLFEHTLLRTVRVTAAVLSRSVAVAQSYVSVSGHTTRYHALRVPPALGAVNVCRAVLSPLVGAVPPNWAAKLPEWLAVVMVAVPVVVQPPRVPVSKPPLMIPPPPPDGLIVKDSVAVCVALEPVPVTVTVYVPVAAAVLVVTVRVDEPPEVTLPGLNEPVAPEGSPLTERLTVCAEPLVVAVLTVEVPLLPWVTVSDVGLSEIEKSLGGGVIVKASVVLCVALLPVPVMVIV